MKKRFFKLLAVTAAAAMLLCGCNGSEGTTTAASGNAPTDGGAGDTLLTDSSALTEKTSGNGNVGEVTLEAGDTYAVISVKDYGDITIKLYPDLAPNGVKQFVDLANSGYYEGKNFHRIIANFMIQGGSMNGDGMSGLPEGYSEFDVERDYNLRHFYGALCFANAAGKNGAQFYIVNSKESTDTSKLTAETLDAYIAQAEDYVEQAKAMGEGYEVYVSYYQTQVDMYKAMADYAEHCTDEISAKYKEQGGALSLDGGYTVFGQTVDGFDVIDAITAVEVVDNGNGETSKPTKDILIDTVKIYKK